MSANGDGYRCAYCGTHVTHDLTPATHRCGGTPMFGTDTSTARSTLTGKRDASWKQIAAEYQSERDALRADVNRAREMQAAAEAYALALEAKVDALMLEYCPDEMTGPQLERWASFQRRAAERAKP